MSLVSCRECKKDVSKDAKVCPNCGIENPYKKKRINSIIGILFIVALVFVVFLSDEKRKSKEINTEKLVTKKDALFTEKELKVYTYLVRDEIDKLLDNGNSIFDKYLNYVNVSANNIQLEYEKNEINADKKYEKKDLIITGKVKSIEKDAYGNPYLSLYGGSNQFINPQAKFDGNLEWLATVKKNEIVTIVCNNSNMIIGSVFLQNCMPYYNWSKVKTIEIVNNTEKILQDDNLKLNNVVKLVKVLTPKLQETSACFKDDTSKCFNEISKLIPTLKNEIENIKNNK